MQASVAVITAARITNCKRYMSSVIGLVVDICSGVYECRRYMLQGSYVIYTTDRGVRPSS